MKRLITGTILMLVLFTSLNALAQRDPSARAAEMKQKLKTDLQLTDIQADSVTAINREFMPQRREIFQDQSLSADDKKSKMKEVTDQSDKRIQAVLGDDLFKKYQDWRLKNMQRRRGGGGNN
ncbi:MAG: hypothetical protein Q8918_11295 [Bacteroidota bacterium]|nr:hypothetical protein [Bacteroidota bacterium]MDP4250682.1 hypothetical protein [Bacteroidota bacterium]